MIGNNYFTWFILNLKKKEMHIYMLHMWEMSFCFNTASEANKRIVRLMVDGYRFHGTTYYYNFNIWEIDYNSNVTNLSPTLLRSSGCDVLTITGMQTLHECSIIFFNPFKCIFLWFYIINLIQIELLLKELWAVAQFKLNLMYKIMLLHIVTVFINKYNDHCLPIMY